MSLNDGSGLERRRVMAYHPRENWDPARRRRLQSRREFLKQAAALGIALPGLGAILAACGDDSPGSAISLPIGTPDSPVTQPLSDANAAIASGLDAEAGPLRVYNWAEYINPDVIPLAEEAIGASIEVTTFFNLEESIQKLASGEVQFDVWFPTGNYISKAVAGELVQPLNHEYLPNLAANVWPALADPFYDGGSLYSVPYTVYQTGIGWRIDQVDDEDVLGLENPWDVFWNPKYKSITGLYDDFQETLTMAMFRNGVADPTNAGQNDIDAAADSLAELVDLMNIRYTIDGAYAGIPENRFGLHHAWSGDMIGSQYYYPEDQDPSVGRYAWPAKIDGSTAKGNIANDCMAVLKGAANPVLAHRFLDYLLDNDAALENFGWLGYQPPITSIDPDTLVADEWVLPDMGPAIVREDDFANPQGYVPTQLSPETEQAWNGAWSRAKGTA
jgi:spermidine/putrescine transport system substrate-binding protein